MLTYDEIIKYINEKNLSNLITPYHGINGTGVIYYVEIEDYGVKEPRLATFDNINELAEFSDKISCSDKITTMQRDLVVSEPKFMLRGKILTTQTISAEKKKQKMFYAAQKEYYLYKSHRGQILIIKIEKIKKEIADLEETIKQFTKKEALLFKNDISNQKQNPLPSSEEFDIESLPLDKNTISNVNFTKLKVTYESLRKKKQLLLDKLDLLTEFAQKSFIKKLKTSQKGINSALNELDKQADLSQKKTYTDLLTEEYKITEIIDKFNFSPAPKYAEYFLELLNFYKIYDSNSIETNADDLIENEYSVLKNLLSRCAREETRINLESSAPSQEEKNSKLLLNLKKQYDENLTEDQKDALLIYNSQFFALIGEISNIEDFETTDNIEILKQIEQSPIYEHILSSLNSHCMMVEHGGMIHYGEIDTTLSRIMKKILPDKTASKFLDILPISPYTKTSNNMEYTNHMCDLIERLKQVIKTIQDIPQNAIVLPEDITVYRGIDSCALRNPQFPAKGAFISTSMKPEVAMKFGGDVPAIYKIHLKAGTPVKILPQKVYSVPMEFCQRFVKDVDPADSTGTKEILLCTDDMQEFEITESISPITHYQFENGELKKSKSGFIITGEMEPKIVQQINQEINDKEK